MGYQILITDDEEVLRRSCAEFLRLSGYDVVEFASGVDLLAYLDEPETHADLLLLDISMPQFSGIDVLKRMLALSLSMPVVLLSGYPSPEHDADIGYHPLIYLRKPVLLPKLLLTIEELLAPIS